jgi:hypothetical protein
MEMGSPVTAWGERGAAEVGTKVREVKGTV